MSFNSIANLQLPWVSYLIKTKILAIPIVSPKEQQWQLLQTLDFINWNTFFLQFENLVIPFAITVFSKEVSRQLRDHANEPVHRMRKKLQERSQGLVDRHITVKSMM